jgi:uncharacterized membrane-anchored protein
VKNPKERRPRWFLLYGLVGVVAVALYFESKMPVSGAMRIIAQLVVLGLASYLVFRWIDSEMPFDNWS